MVKTLFIVLTLFALLTSVSAQDRKGHFEVEITKLNIGLSPGYFTGRDKSSNSGFATLGQIYFPFRWALDYDTNFSEPRINEYDERIIQIRPSVIFQRYSDLAYGFGLGNQFSWKLVRSLYLEYQIGLVYNEAKIAAKPDIFSGFSLHHSISIATPISKQFTLFVVYMHLSNAGIIDGENSIVDVYGIGIRFNTF